MAVVKDKSRDGDPPFFQKLRIRTGGKIYLQFLRVFAKNLRKSRNSFTFTKNGLLIKITNFLTKIFCTGTSKTKRVGNIYLMTF
jgi:hypothetical protein